jgi:hypothetical protein
MLDVILVKKMKKFTPKMVYKIISRTQFYKSYLVTIYSDIGITYDNSLEPDSTVLPMFVER